MNSFSLELRLAMSLVLLWKARNIPEMSLMLFDTRPPLLVAGVLAITCVFKGSCLKSLQKRRRFEKLDDFQNTNFKALKNESNKLSIKGPKTRGLNFQFCFSNLRFPFRSGLLQLGTQIGGKPSLMWHLLLKSCANFDSTHSR